MAYRNLGITLHKSNQSHCDCSNTSIIVYDISLKILATSNYNNPVLQ